MTFYERNGDDIDRGLVGYWKLDDKKADPSVSVAIDRANFNDGTITGAIGTTDINSVTNNAMSFDGDDDIVTIFNGFNLQPPFSVNLWFNAGVIGSIDYLFHRNDDEPGFRFDGDDGRLQILLDNSSSPNIKTISNISKNTWLMATITYDGINAILYLNRIFQATGIHLIFSSSSNSYRFASDGAAGRFFNGSINKIRIYKRTLTQGEVSKLYRLRK